MAKAFNRTGRSKGNGRFVALPHHMMDTMAWGPSVTARAAWPEIVRAHNGSNNGHIAISVRLLAKRLGVCKTTAATAIRELITYGFLEITKQSSFSGKRRATQYCLTHVKNDITGEPGSHAFQGIGKAQLWVEPHGHA